MSDYDLLVRSQSWEGEPLCIAVSEGVIQDVAPDLQGSADQEIDGSDCRIWPGWIDAHVHFNEPGRTDWEGLAHGSKALALGGGTSFFDMPLNSSPPVLDKESFEEKQRLASITSHLDFALWGGMTPASLLEIESMADCGAIGFKAFMCPSGLDEFLASDPKTLRRGMTLSAARGLPVAVHAEVEPEASVGGSDMKAWLASRPIAAELEAIRIALDLAGETGCPLHIVHISNPEGIELVMQAKAAGVDVTAETCPHYLLLDTEDAITIGPFAKCAPPLRGRATVEGLREQVRRGNIDTIGSDHSPSPPELKQSDDLFSCWGGIAGIQDGFPLMIDEDLADPNMLSGNVARRFRLPGKGGLKPGHDADFILICHDPRQIQVADSVTRYPHSPYTGRTASHRVMATYLRGVAVSDEPRGRFLRPSQS
ncbi:MAG: allantoinase AllB [Verrucomicrobiota bacterium]